MNKHCWQLYNLQCFCFKHNINCPRQLAQQKLALSWSFRCDQIRNNQCYESADTLWLCLSLTKMFNKPTSVEAVLRTVCWTKNSCLAPALCVTKFITIGSHFAVVLKSDLDATQIHLWSQLFEENITLSCSLKLDLIHNNLCYKLSHNLFFCLSPT